MALALAGTWLVGMSWAGAAPPPGATGQDVSYPQCADHSVPSAGVFAIVGVNGGLSFRPNPCLADQLSRAGQGVALYANTGNPGPRASTHWPSGARTPRACPPSPNDDTAACAFDYGWYAAMDSFATASKAFSANGWGDSPARHDWWLDVETANSWRSDVSLNAAAMEGAVAALRSAGAGYIGFYSTGYQWSRLIGATTAFASNPNWVAGASDAADAQTKCDPANSFTGGPVVLTQYVATYDTDYACPSPGSPPAGPATSPPTSPPGTATSTTPSVMRIAGNDRLHTAIATSRDAFPTTGSAAAVVLVRSDPGQFADALSGVPLAASERAPLLLNPVDHLDQDVGAELERVAAKGATVYLLGGTAALAPAVANDVAQRGFAAVRYGGTDRYETAAIIADNGLRNPSRLFEASGTDFADALSAGASAASRRGAVLLTAGSRQAKATADYLSAHPSASRTAVGGPAAAADPSASSVVGADRYDTSVKLAEASFGSPAAVGLASGADYPDALAGGANIANVATSTGPLLLVAPDHLPDPVRSYLASVHAGVRRAALFGGRRAVADAVIDQANRALAGT